MSTANFIYCDGCHKSDVECHEISFHWPYRLARALLLTDRTGTTDRAFDAMDRWEHTTHEPRSALVNLTAAMVACQRQLNERVSKLDVKFER